MAEDSLKTSDVIPAAPEDLFDAWLDGEGHAAMTGADATGQPVVGARFTAWGGYITGQNLEIDRPGRIVQAWRTSQFEDAPDSLLEILFAATDGGTRVTFNHSNLPPEQVADYLQGWEDHYFRPMRDYYNA